jgi:hypothetical protein
MATNRNNVKNFAFSLMMFSPLTSVSVVLFVALVLILGVDMATQAACPNTENAEIQSE